MEEEMVAIQFFELDKLSTEQYNRIMKRAELDISHMLPLAQEVANEVKAKGDAGLVKYARQWDAKNFEASMLRAKPEDFAAARARLEPEVIAGIEAAHENILNF